MRNSATTFSIALATMTSRASEYACLSITSLSMSRLVRRWSRLLAVDDPYQLGHRLVELRRYYAIDRNLFVHGAGERHVLEDGNVVLGSDLSDLEREQILPLRHHDGRSRLLPHIAQRNRKVCRVGDDERGARHRLDHAPARPVASER